MGAYKKERLLYLIQTALRMNGGTLETNQITRYYPDRDAGKLKVGCRFLSWSVSSHPPAFSTDHRYPAG
jgi:hypothetical protein